MIFGKTKLEMKLGIFVFVGMIITIVFILSIGKVKTWSSGSRVNFIFNFVNGVKIGAPVRLAGVDVGEVKQIELFFNPKEAKDKVRINCWVHKKARIPTDSTIWINTLVLLGEKYIEIMPVKDQTNFLVADGEIIGTDPMPMQEITELAKRIGSNIDEAVGKVNSKQGTVGKLIYDDTIYNELEALVKDVRRNPWKLFIKTKEKK